jgi:L-lactate dehydrogenase complex protein LldG
MFQEPPGGFHAGFLRELKKLQVAVSRCSGPEPAAEVIASLIEKEGYPDCGWSDAARCMGLAGILPARVMQCMVSCPPCRREQTGEPCDPGSLGIGLTACDALIASTGGILVSRLSAGPRWLSVLPPVHIIVAHSRQLVSDMHVLLERKMLEPKDSDWWCFISGPSRTADIEKQLVLGAHGPRALHLVLIETDDDR